MIPPPDQRHSQVHLETGGLIITSEPRWIFTVLGSCVAITFFHRTTRLASICHAMLPRPRHEPGPTSAKSEDADAGRFVVQAIAHMLDAFRQRGLQPRHIEVKLFGGANVLPAGPGHSQEQWVGSANIAAAREALQAAQLRIAAENVGGFRGCKIFFNTQTGEVFHRHIATPHERHRQTHSRSRC